MITTFIARAARMTLLAATLAPAALMSTQAFAQQVIYVANGCGPDAYRGPGGACHPFGRGPFPGGYFGPYGHSFALDRGCGAGRYRGPYGSCHKFGTGPYPQGYFGPYYQ